VRKGLVALHGECWNV